MAMLPPKYNHLGRSKRKTTKPSASLVQARKDHEQFLASVGIKPRKRIRLKGAVPLQDDRAVRTPELIELSTWPLKE